MQMCVLRSARRHLSVIPVLRVCVCTFLSRNCEEILLTFTACMHTAKRTHVAMKIGPSCTHVCVKLVPGAHMCVCLSSPMEMRCEDV